MIVGRQANEGLEQLFSKAICALLTIRLVQYTFEDWSKL